VAARSAAQIVGQKQIQILFRSLQSASFTGRALGFINNLPHRGAQALQENPLMGARHGFRRRRMTVGPLHSPVLVHSGQIPQAGKILQLR